MSAQSGSLNNDLGFEADISNKNNLLLWLGFAGFSLGLIVLIYVFSFYFLHEVEQERYRKFVLTESVEIRSLNRRETAWLSGSKSLVEGNISVPIDDAISKFILLESKKI